MSKELQARTEADSSTTAELLPSANLAQNPVLAAVHSKETAMQKHINRLKQLRDLYELGTPQHNCFSIAFGEAMAELKNELQQIQDAFITGITTANYSSVAIDEEQELFDEYYNKNFFKR